MVFTSLSDIHLTNIIEAFQKAFCDYTVKFDSREIESMLKRRGFCQELSFAAFENDEISAFVLNGVGFYNGKLCCYDCGTGTLPEYRGLGLAGKLFQKTLPELKNAGVRDYILEVLTSNTTAINIYKKTGFEIVSYYDCFNQSIRNIKQSPTPLINISVKRIDNLPLEAMISYYDFIPSWQNSLESIRRANGELIYFAAIHNNKNIGYCVCDPQSGDIASIVVDPNFRRLGVGGLLINSALSISKAPKLKLLNVDKDCKSLHLFLEALGFDQGLSQYGMIKSLD